MKYLKEGSKIHIKESHKGKFTEYCNGNVTQKCIDEAKQSGNPTLVKQAIFAENARKWKHAKGGHLKLIPKGQSGLAAANIHFDPTQLQALKQAQEDRKDAYNQIVADTNRQKLAEMERQKRDTQSLINGFGGLAKTAAQIGFSKLQDHITDKQDRERAANLGAEVAAVKASLDESAPVSVINSELPTGEDLAKYEHLQLPPINITGQGELSKQNMNGKTPTIEKGGKVFGVSYNDPLDDTGVVSPRTKKLIKRHGNI